MKIILVGSGLAALTFLTFLDETQEVFWLSDQKEGASWHAQGGIATSFAEKSIEAHVADTLRAGCYLNDEKVVRTMIEKGNQTIAMLLDQGVLFDAKGGKLRFALEAAHSESRILHKGQDQTGYSLCDDLFMRLKDRFGIHYGTLRELVKEGHKVSGITWQDETNVYETKGDGVVLATGGYSALFEPASFINSAGVYTLAAAQRAGLAMENLEMEQFHPTVFFFKGKTICLVSEAVRGAGGVLRTKDGRAIMADFPKKDLEPRHVVAKRIHEVLATEDVFLDISAVDDFKENFPFIYSKISEYGITTMIPVRPAAHYSMGGIKAQSNGQTTMDGLYVLGECAFTGFHGANRLASNSLLETLAMGRVCAENLNFGPTSETTLETKALQDPLWNFTEPWFRQEMMKYCGIIRKREDLLKLLDFLEDEKKNHKEEPAKSLLEFAENVVLMALSRKSSLGAHQIESTQVTPHKNNIIHFPEKMSNDEKERPTAKGAL